MRFDYSDIEKEIYMIWIFLALAAIAIAFITLGALSVWVSVLSMALKAMLAAALAVPAGIVLIGLWQRFNRRKS